MLTLKSITKNYIIGKKNTKNYQVVHALKDVSINFREHELVSILGQSGCGKTTLLNIIGGLDQYTSGDLLINGKSTKEYSDHDWDNYRNHSIGFIFQSYNLIPHQNVLTNVELALTLSGVDKEERRQRAIDALIKVGLEDKIHSSPNQLSGGQMQRVAIARALVNNPDIILADEPTGALDSKTSLQIMDILKEISKDKLIIMVTHNPDLAKAYSSRIVELFDGEIISDSKPFKEETIDNKKETDKNKKGTKMSFFTALSLSIKNLLTKKARTALVSFAGSIGIIGIALVLSMSNGFQNYIDKVQEETLSTYPISINSRNSDITSLLNMFNEQREADINHEFDAIYSNNMMSKLVNTMMAAVKNNDLAQFKTFLDNDEEAKSTIIEGNVSYTYDVPLNIYKSVDDLNTLPTDIFDTMPGYRASGTMANSSTMMNTLIWSQMIDNSELIAKQYDVVAGKMPANYNEIVVILDKNNEINDFVLYGLGLLSDEEYSNITNSSDAPSIKINYETVLDKKYIILPTAYYYRLDSNNVAQDKRGDAEYLKSELQSNDAIEVNVVGIIKPKEENIGSVLDGNVAYLSDLTKEIINKNNKSSVVQYQMANPSKNVFTGHEFEEEEKVYDCNDLITYFASLIDDSADNFIQNRYDYAQYIYDGLCRWALTNTIERTSESLDGALGMYYVNHHYETGFNSFNDFKNYYLSLDIDSRVDYFRDVIDAALINYCKDDLDEINDNTNYDNNLKILGVCDENVPHQINIYANDFKNKEDIVSLIEKYNAKQVANSNEDATISYTDYVGLLMSSVSTIIDIISTVLIVFVSISLVVSSIMIGVITYISVLERIKEIGILRAIGASKRDIKRVFTAESVTIGFLAGAAGIVITALLLIPGNIILKSLTDISNLAKLPLVGALILIGVSIFMTFIAGLIPARLASKKDPVIALRTE